MVAAQQVITVHPDGTMSGLQRKAGQGLDLTKFGSAEIKRASEIEWDVERQKWFINLRVVEPGPVTVDKVRESVGSLAVVLSPDWVGWAIWNNILYFDDYDDAVKAEIKVLDGYRKQGRF